MMYYSQYVEPLWLHELQPLCHITVVRDGEPEPPIDNAHVFGYVRKFPLGFAVVVVHEPTQVFGVDRLT